MDKKVLFEALNTELAKENIDLEIICVEETSATNRRFFV